MQLTPRQSAIVDQAVPILRQSPGGVLLALHFGFGKTVVAVRIARSLSFPVIVLAPLSTQSHFQRHFGDPQPTYVTLTANNYYGEIRPYVSSLTPRLIVIDEAHNLFRGILNTADQANSLYQLLLAHPYHRLLFLTGHPIGKRDIEINACINLLHLSVRIPLYHPPRLCRFWLMKGRTFFIPFDPLNVDFPSCSSTAVHVDTTHPGHLRRLEQLKEMGAPHVTQQILTNNGLAESAPGVLDYRYCPKVRVMLQLISGKTIIYSSTKGWGGVALIVAALKEKNIPHHVFTGDLSTKERDRVLGAFNASKADVLVITNAGMEGINTVGVRTTILFEPTWTYTQAAQLKFRSIRYGSHQHLPVEERRCVIYVLCCKGTVDDVKLLNIKNYQRQVEKVTECLKTVSMGP